MASSGRFDHRPLYLQVRDELIRRIKIGYWKPGGAIPNELEIARELGVSAGTVRKALTAMELEKIIVRRQGRGTFVSDQASTEMTPRYSSIRDAAGDLIRTQVGRSQVVRGAATDIELQRLSLPAGAEVLRVCRVLHYRQRPFIAEAAIFPVQYYPRLLQDMGAYDLAALAQQNGILLGKAEEKLSITFAEPPHTAALDVEERTPLLLCDRIVFSVDGLRIQWLLAHCHLLEEHYRADMS